MQIGIVNGYPKLHLKSTPNLQSEISNLQSETLDLPPRLTLSSITNFAGLFPFDETRTF
jgi:hypothetical protein